MIVTDETQTEDGVHVIHTGTGNMTPEQFAFQQGRSLRTVRRWLADGEVVGAWQHPDNLKWTIRHDAYRQPNPVERAAVMPSYVYVQPSDQPGTDVAVPDQARQLEAPREPTRLEDLAEESAFLTVADAAAYLGIPQAQILAQPEVFDVMHVGVNGSPRVPKSTIKKFEG